MALQDNLALCTKRIQIIVFTKDSHFGLSSKKNLSSSELSQLMSITTRIENWYKNKEHRNVQTENNHHHKHLKTWKQHGVSFEAQYNNNNKHMSHVMQS